MRALLTYKPIISHRIDGATIAASSVGAIVSVLVGPHDFWFLDAWVGAALAWPLGLGLGILWQFSQSKDPSLSRSQLSLAVLASLGAAALAATQLRWAIQASAKVEELRTLAKDSLVRIDVHEPFTLQRIETIDDPEELSAFVLAARDIRIAHPGKHAREPFPPKWYVLTLADGRSIRLSLEGGPPGSVYGMFLAATSDGNSVAAANEGEFGSAGLLTWARKREPVD